MAADSGPDRNGLQGAELAGAIIGKRWKPAIIWLLSFDALRFTELFRGLPGVSPKVLTQQLRDLERDRLVERRIQGERATEYALTAAGAELARVVHQFARWGTDYGNADPCAASRYGLSGANDEATRIPSSDRASLAVW